jgi:hypothetical protein
LPLAAVFRDNRDSLNARCAGGPAWVNEIKHDGYRLMVRRGGTRVLGAADILKYPLQKTCKYDVECCHSVARIPSR